MESLLLYPGIDLITGGMFGQKTSELVRRLNLYHAMGLSVIYINSSLDTRAETTFSTHNTTIGSIPFYSMKLKNLKDCENMSDFEHYDVIGIDEGQFFSDLKECVTNWSDNKGKIVIVAGLNGDSNRRPFGQFNDLLPYCDNIIKLSPFCTLCKNEKQKIRAALFSKKIVKDESIVVIGGKEAYIPVCRDCYKS